MRKERRETDRFQVKTADGRRFEVIEFTDYIGIETLSSGGIEWEPGLHSFKVASNGGHLNRNDDGSFEVVQTGERVVRM